MANVLRLILAALALAITPAPALAQTTTLTMSSWVSPQHHLTSVVLQGWATEVEKATNGRVKFTMLPKHPSAPPGTFDAVRDGLVDLSYVTASYTPARHILPLMPELPGAGDTALVNSVAYSRIYWKHFHEVGEYKGVKLLGVFTHGPGQMFTKKPVDRDRRRAGPQDPHRRRGRGGGGQGPRGVRVREARAGILRAAQGRRGRRRVLPARVDRVVQARDRARAGHALPGRHVQLRLRLLHERGQVEQAAQAGPGRDHQALGRAHRPPGRPLLGRGRREGARGAQEVGRQDRERGRRPSRRRCRSAPRPSWRTGSRRPPPRASTRPRSWPSSGRS